MILNKKTEQAQINFDLLREEGRSDKFFNDKISYLLGIQEKIDDKIKQVSEFEKKEMFDPNEIAALIDKSKEELAETTAPAATSIKKNSTICKGTVNIQSIYL